MTWEKEIAEELQAVQDVAVRFDIQQDLTNIEKTRAKNNIGIGSSATNITGDDYAIVLNY